MKIYTKTGDAGETSLFGGKRVSKAADRIEAYGSVDELNSYIGWLRDQEINISRAALLEDVQNCLFTMGAMLAADPDKKQLHLPKINSSGIVDLENAIDEMELHLEPLKNFILPGGHASVSFCHVARCVCRRAERHVIRLHEHEPVEILIITYLNRLSDYLFVLSRIMAKDLKVQEIIWKTRD